MKKLSFFLMAMLISVMSFAETELFTQTYPGSPSSYTNAYTKSFTVTTGDYTLTYTNINNGQASNAWTAIRSGSKNGASVATIASEQIAAPIAKVVINFTQANASSTNALYLEVSANSDFSSATKIAADIAVGNVEFPIAAPAANQYYKITIDQAKGSANGFNRFDKVVFYQGEAAGEDVEIVAAPEFSVTEANFTTAFTLDITSEEGTTLKYTIDNTDPSTSATAIEVATNSTSVQITKSTAVKAIAIKGELKSVTKSKVYCYVNSAETAYTVAEAMEVIDAGLGLANELYVKGEISTIEKYDANYGSITYWIKDEEGNKFECYSGLGLNKAKFTSKEDVEVGASVVACGVMKLFVTSSGDKIYEFNYNNYLVEYVAPVVSYVVTVSANPAEAGTVTGGGKYEEGATATLTATANEGYEFVKWTENEVEVSTDAEYTFEVLADRALVANFKEAEPEGIEVVLENAYKEVYLVWNRANFFGEHATYGDISVQVNNYNGYGTYAEGVSSRIDGVKVNGSATFENKGETDLLTATLTDAEETVVYIVKAEVPTPKTYEVVATNATYVNLEGWSGAELTVNGLTLGEEELTLTVYWDGVGGSEEGYEASAGFEGSLQGMILVDKGEDDVLSFEGTLKDASDNSYIFDFEATPKVAETYTLTFEDMVIEPGQWDDNLHITAENTEYAIEFQLFGGKTKGYGEYGFTDDYPDVDEIYINFEYATMAEGTVANYYLNEETGLATIELTVVLGIDIYNITLTGQPLVNPEDIVPTDTINITMTKATIGLSQGMPKVAASSEEAELSIVLVGENPYKATVEDFSASSYLVTVAGELTFLRGGLEIVEVGDVKIAYIGVLCSDHKWYNITLTTGTELPTALENLDTTVAPAKAIVNGQLVIIKNGVQYNAQGAVVK